MPDPTDLAPDRRALVIDDEESIRFFLRRTLERSGWTVTTAEDGTRGVESFREHGADIVITDLKMPDMDGIQVLERIRALDSDALVVVITGFGTIESAVAAMKRGAADYLTKPFDAATIRAVVKRHTRPAAKSAGTGDGPRIIGRSPSMSTLKARVAQVAKTDATVLIRGESGTGKEVVARAIHRGGDRATQPFVAVHCASLPPLLLEAQLFGHDRGAFTGAISAHEGYATRAGRGTLLLDEVGDIPLPLQAKLLRVLQEREYTPLGRTTAEPLEARVLAATHRDLAAMVEVGDFREDLLYRLDVVRIDVPPLRERSDDVDVLIDHFLAHDGGDAPPKLGAAVRRALTRYAWPGNVRELHNLVERFVALEPGGEIEPEDLPPEVRHGGLVSGGSAVGVRSPGSGLPFETARTAFERDYFARLLKASDGNLSEAARRAGISRPNLYRRLARLGLER